ncbi:MAG: autotransporter outer membrane beta-barrel domain-containing protein [Planctomycetaceae bacterium]|nr:autotransporter outer membrane beta-barrel domain-containing protein [Planctomycetaceae bacterium]
MCGSSPWRVNAWIEGFGTGFDYRGSLTNADYNGSFSGTSFGYERTRDDLTLGIFGNYSNHQLNGDGRAEGEWGNVGVYGRIDNRKSFVETSLAYGFGEYDMTRNIVIPGAVFSGAGPDAPAIVLPAWFKQANSKLRTDAFSLRLAGGRDVRKINGWKIGTRAEFSLAYVNVGAYTETGAQSLNLAMDKYGSTYLEGGVGLFAGKRLRNLMATGKLMGMYGGSSGNNMNGKFAQFGSRFSTNPKSNTTAWIVPETTLSWNLSRNVVFSGSYSGRFGEKYSENTGTIALSLYR